MAELDATHPPPPRRLRDDGDRDGQVGGGLRVPEDLGARIEALDLHRRLKNVGALASAFAVISGGLGVGLLAVHMDFRVVLATWVGALLFAASCLLTRTERWRRHAAVVFNVLVMAVIFAAVAVNRQIGPGAAFVAVSLFAAAATLPLRGVVLSGIGGAGIVVAMGYVARETAQTAEPPSTATTYGVALCGVTTVLSIIQVRNARRALMQVAERERHAGALSSQLQQVQKMDALGRMAAAVAHDFNNLLGVIRTGTAIAARDVAPDGRASEALRTAEKAALEAAALTKRLLAFSRKEVHDLAVIDPRDTLTGLAELLPRAVGPGVEVDMRLEDELPPVLAAPAQVEQVVLNLAINARDAMPEGGKLTVAARSRAEADGGRHGGSDWLELEIKDTGSGMNAEVMEHLFEPFFTTKPEGQGTGLGLSTCYGIVTQLGGTIHAESAVGRGTTFTILLPRAGAKSNRPPA